jgi:hypothetical protein
MEEEQTHLDAFELYFKLETRRKWKKQKVSWSSIGEYNRMNLQYLNGKKKLRWDEREAIRSSEINSNIQRRLIAR